MSYLLFMDESGHDHREAPYEVRGGVALHVNELWQFILDVQEAEHWAFGCCLHDLGHEIKGRRLLRPSKFSYASGFPWYNDATRQKLSFECLRKGKRKEQQHPIEICAYAQAGIAFVRRLFDILRARNATFFAAAIPKGVKKPKVASGVAGQYPRKDHVFLFERYYYFLQERREHGLLVMDETQKEEDRRFVQRMQDYYTMTQRGRERTAWVVPRPFFVSSDMVYPIQTADICIYCVNWGFRLPKRQMDAPVREEIKKESSLILS